MTDTTGLKAYTSHKRVHAAEIKSVGNYYLVDELKLVRSITLVDGPIVDIGEEVFKRYTPLPGDFYVVYADGYQSFSPRKAFLDGYKLTDDRTFTDIKQEISLGKAHPDKA